MESTIHVVDWRVADEALSLCVRRRQRVDHELGRALLDALEAGAHVELGFGSFVEYAERRCGFTPRETRERLRVARALRELPLLDEALSAGEITWSAAREVSRVADEVTEGEWLAEAQARSQRDLEHRVARHAYGDRPGDPPRRELARHRLSFEVSGHVYALWREVEEQMTREAGEALDPEELLVLVARRILGGPSEEGRASYQVTTLSCPDCRTIQQMGRGDCVALDAADAEMVECDAQRIDSAGRAHQDIPPATRRQVMLRDHGRCTVPGCTHATWVDVHHIRLRSEGGDHDPSNLTVLCGAHHRALHHGALQLSGHPDVGLAFRHADGAPYGSSAVDPDRVTISNDVFQLLRAWGVKERAARRAVALAMTRTGHGSDRDVVIRAALAEIRGGTPLRSRC